MLTSTVMLIYEIVWDEYRVEFKTMLWAQLNQSVIFSSGDRSWSELFFRFLFLEIIQDQIFRIGEKSSLPIQFHPIYMGWWNFSSSFFAVMIILSVIITFNVYGGFFLSSYHFPRMGMGCLTSDFELTDDVIVVETSYLLSIESRSWFALLNHFICPLGAPTSGRETFAHLQMRSPLNMQIAYNLLLRGLLAWALETW